MHADRVRSTESAVWSRRRPRENFGLSSALPLAPKHLLRYRRASPMKSQFSHRRPRSWAAPVLPNSAPLMNRPWQGKESGEHACDHCCCTRQVTAENWIHLHVEHCVQCGMRRRQPYTIRLLVMKLAFLLPREAVLSPIHWHVLVLAMQVCLHLLAT